MDNLLLTQENKALKDSLGVYTIFIFIFIFFIKFFWNLTEVS